MRDARCCCCPLPNGLLQYSKSYYECTPLTAASLAQIPKKQVVLALGLLAGGVLLLIIGLSLYFTDPEANSTPAA